MTVILSLQILDRISLQYVRNANKRKTQMKRTKNEQTLHTNDTKNARYTKQMHDTQNQRTIHEQTNHWSVHVAIYYPMTNDPGSFEVQYSIVLLFEWLLCKLA